MSLAWGCGGGNDEPDTGPDVEFDGDATDVVDGDRDKDVDNDTKDVNRDPTAVAVRDLSASGSFACAAVETGEVYCWGKNDDGQLGDGTEQDREAPVRVAGITEAIDVEAGDSHACALLKTGAIRCWGSGLYGSLGNGSKEDSSSPVAVSGISSAKTLVVYNNSYCARLESGALRCWGSDDRSQLGDGAGRNGSTPVEPEGISSATEVFMGGGVKDRNVIAHTCAIVDGGKLFCWGANEKGQLGDGSTNSRKSPVRVQGISSAVDVALSRFHSCAVLEDGSVRCWGSNAEGQLGNGAGDSSNTAVKVQGISSATRVVATTPEGLSDSPATCVLLEDGSIRCWGENLYGILGDGTDSGGDIPVEVKNLSDAAEVDLSGGGRFGCARLESGTVECWGSSSANKLGRSVSEELSPPVEVPDVSEVMDLEVSTGGALFSCVSIGSGGAKCWGNDRDGNLGDGEKTSTGPSWVQF